MDARGAVTNYTYDTLNRLTQVSYQVPSGVASTPTVTYQYDTNQASATTGLLMSVLIGGGASNAGGSEENYTYDTLGRISTLQRRINVSPSVIRSYTSSYQYNEAGQAKQITYPSGRLIQPSYDNVGRMSALSGTANYVPSVSYDTIGRVSGMSLGNGVVESYGYDAQRMQMTSQTAVKGATTLMSLTYNFQASAGQMGTGSTAGNAGQLMTVTGSIGGQAESAAYTYDLLGRLVTSNQTTNGVSAQRRFVYDRWGNRTAVYDATSGGTQIQSIALEQSGGAPTNRIASVTSGGTVNYVYDAAGNVTSDGAHSFTYDAENRLVSVDGGATAVYGYDHSNRRIKKTVGGVTTHCVWEGAKVIAENAASSGALNVEYVYSGGRMIASIASGVTRYYLADRLSARVTLDTAGNIVGRQSHLPFGEELNASGTTDKHRFTSYERDSETGTDYAINRQYAQSIGRFTRPDPYRKSCNVSSPQSLNRYTYTSNDPINRVDPNGLIAFILLDCHAETDVIDMGSDYPDYEVFFTGRETCEVEVINIDLLPGDDGQGRRERLISKEACLKFLEEFERFMNDADTPEDIRYFWNGVAASLGGYALQQNDSTANDLGQAILGLGEILESPLSDPASTNRLFWNTGRRVREYYPQMVPSRYRNALSSFAHNGWASLQRFALA
jgi:RHS repeat-associated protein